MIDRAGHDGSAGNDAGLHVDRQDGAVAVIVAIMLVVLLGMLAFAVDLGLAYNLRQDLQTAADAAALAAAGELAARNAECPPASDDEDAAAAVAQEVMIQNLGTAEAVPDEFAAVCDGDDIVVSWAARGVRQVVFGGVLGGGAPPDVVARAHAAVTGVELGAVRPWFLCSTQVPSTSLQTAPVQVSYTPPTPPGFGGLSACPSMQANWWTTDCPPAGGGPGVGDDNLAANTVAGCGAPVLAASVAGGTGTTRTRLLAECPDDAAESSPDCLAGNDVAFDGVGADDVRVREALYQLVCGQAATGAPSGACALNGPEIQLPVICGMGPDTCTPLAAIAGLVPAAPQEQYPVYDLVTVTMCGFSFGPDAAYSTAGLCSGMSAPAADANSLWLVFHDGQREVSLVQDPG